MTNPTPFLRKLRGWLAAALPGLLAFASLDGNASSAKDLTQAFGPFEVVTHVHGYTSGWNNGKMYRAVEETAVSISYKGQPISLPGKSGVPTTLFDSAYLLPSAVPAIVVVVGTGERIDDGCGFYLVREVDGALKTEVVATSDKSGSNPIWLDASPETALIFSTPRLQRIAAEGPHLLALALSGISGQKSVIDTRTLALHPFKADLGYKVEPRQSLGMSPDQKSAVFFGLGNDDASHQLLVFDFVSNRYLQLPIDHQRMRYMEFRDIDAAWVDHHFEWKHVKGADDELVQRAAFKPLPFRGKYTRYSSSEDSPICCYKLRPVTPAITARVEALLRTEFHAVDAATPSRSETERSLTIDGLDLRVALGYDPKDFSVMITKNFEVDEKCTALVRRIGARIDALLATGEWDGLFEP